MLVVLSLVALATGVVSADSYAAKYSKKHLLDLTLKDTSLSQDQIYSYGVRAITWLAPGVVVGAVALLSMLFYCTFKYCCDCCGGRNQSVNFCMPNPDLPVRYTKGELLRPKIYAGLILLWIAGSFAWGYAGTSLLTKGAKDMVAAVEAIPGVLKTKLDAIDVMLTVTVYDPTTDKSTTEQLLRTSGLYDTATSLIKKLQDLVNSAVAQFQQYLPYAESGSYVLFGVPLVCGILTALCALINIRSCLPMTATWVLFLLAVLVWVLHGGLSGVSLVVHDVCVEVHAVSNGQANVLEAATGCKDSLFSSFKSNFKSLENTKAKAVCEQIASSCYVSANTPEVNVQEKRVFDCPSGGCQTITFAALLERTKSSYKINSNVANHFLAIATGSTCETVSKRSDCSIATCATDCTANGTLSALGKTAKALYVGFTAASQVSESIETLGAEFSTCETVFRYILAVFDTPCTALNTGLDNMRQASGLLGLGILGAIFVGAWGAKRFVSLDQAGQVVKRPNEDN